MPATLYDRHLLIRPTVRQHTIQLDEYVIIQEQAGNDFVATKQGSWRGIHAGMQLGHSSGRQDWVRILTYGHWKHRHSARAAVAAAAVHVSL